MASSICSVLTMPFLHYHHCGAAKKTQISNLDTSDLSCQAASSNEVKIISPNNLVDLNMTIRSKCQDLPLASCWQHLRVSEADFFAASYCRHIKIVGYWIGPDIEDGCGYVEATLAETLL